MQVLTRLEINVQSIAVPNRRLTRDNGAPGESDVCYLGPRAASNDTLDGSRLDWVAPLGRAGKSEESEDNQESGCHGWGVERCDCRD